MPVDVSKGYKTELIYQGLSDGDIKFAYHEYENDMARPSFSQIVDYDYSAGDAIVTLKGARLTVHEATSGNLTYTLEKGFVSYVDLDEGLPVGEDLFVSEGTALITRLGRGGFFKGWSGCEIGQIVAPDLSISIFGEPRMSGVASAEDSLIVEAGPAKVLALCYHSTPFGDFRLQALFDFIAEAGHTYTFSGSESGACLNLLDVTTDEQIVACETFFSGRYADLSTGDDTAVIKAGGASRNKGNCRPTTGGRGGRRDFLEVDAGLTTISGECQARVLPDMFGNRRRQSNFEFIAEAGHTYTITATDKECMSLLDITFEEIVIACEPYEKSE